jgi:hypothetical protein
VGGAKLVVSAVTAVTATSRLKVEPVQPFAIGVMIYFSLAGLGVLLLIVPLMTLAGFPLATPSNMESIGLDVGEGQV